MGVWVRASDGADSLYCLCSPGTSLCGGGGRRRRALIQSHKSDKSIGEFVREN